MCRIVVSLLLLSCLGCTFRYVPISEMERGAFEVSVFDVFPDDVRSDFSAHRDSQLAWAGLIASVSIDESSSPAVMRLRVDHRFFSWAVDGTTRQYWLSPRGEGSFTTNWPMKPEWDLDRMRELILEQDMVIVYGTPESLHNSTIDLGRAAYIRHIPKAHFRTDRIEYGRPGDESRVISAF